MDHEKPSTTSSPVVLWFEFIPNIIAWIERNVKKTTKTNKIQGILTGVHKERYMDDQT